MGLTVACPIHIQNVVPHIFLRILTYEMPLDNEIVMKYESQTTALHNHRK